MRNLGSHIVPLFFLFLPSTDISTDHSPDVKIKHLQEMFHKHGGKFKQSANPTTDGSTLLIFADKEGLSDVLLVKVQCVRADGGHSLPTVPAVKTFMRSGKVREPSFIWRLSSNQKLTITRPSS